MLIVVRGINLICGKQFMVLRKGKISMADSFTPLLSVEIGLLLWATRVLPGPIIFNGLVLTLKLIECEYYNFRVKFLF